jgi:predicted RNA binding protein YcfA (HicA-like mRNA interferase family)
MTVNPDAPADDVWCRRGHQRRDAIKAVEAAGWELARTRGSHRQYRHPERAGLVTIAGKPSATLHPKTWATIIKQAGLEDR